MFRNIALLCAWTTLCIAVGCESSSGSSQDRSGAAGEAGESGASAGAEAGAAGKSGTADAGAAGSVASNGGAAGDGAGGDDQAGFGGTNEAGSGATSEGGAGGASEGGFGGGGEAGAGGAGEDLTLGDVNAVITCDNAYGFGWGSLKGLNNYRVAPAAISAGEIFLCSNGPEGYVVPSAEAPPSAYLYAVAWGDHAVTQGLIGQFQRVGGVPVYTGDASWQVCATGVDFDTSNPEQAGGPTREQIDGEIVKCNAGTGDRVTSSAGWVNAAGAVTPNAIGKLAVGEDNSSEAGTFPLVCASGGPGAGLDTSARWMWYTSSGVGDAFSFQSLDVSRPFLIFRLAAGALPASH